MNLFETPIREREVRKGITAYQYRNGCININGQKYFDYSMTEAISLYRKKFPAYPKK
jgi:hypothetical protein